MATIKGALFVLLALAYLSFEGEAAPEKVKKEDIRLKAPWAAAIFKRKGDNEWEFLCSGTVTGRYTVITSARCVIPRVTGPNGKVSSRPHHYRYSDLQVYVGLPTTELSSLDKYTQIGIVGQIRDAYEAGSSGDTAEGDLAAIRLKNVLDLTTPYVKSVQLMESAGTLLEAKETKAGEILLIAGYEKQRADTAPTKAQPSQPLTQKGTPLQIHEIAVEETSRCLELYTGAYSTYYFNVFCGKAPKKSEIIPCYYEGSGIVKKVKDGREEEYFLFGVYSSNSALAKAEGFQADKNRIKPPACAVTDVIFFSRYAHLKRWAISSNFCDNELAMCKSDRCRPWGDLCNAKVECDDGSDESEKVCYNQNKECGKDKFRCGYGACIDKKLSCDGIQDCSDLSDEDPKGVCKGTSSTSSRANTATNGTKSATTCEGIKAQQSVTAHCSHLQRPGLIPCGEPVPIGTSAVLRREEIVINCERDGKWSRSTRLTC